MESIDRFNEWWQHYPRKVAKGAARDEWFKLDRKGVLPSFDVLIKAIKLQVLAYQARPSFKADGWQYFCHARTWLHQERWDDEVPVVIPKSHAAPTSGKYDNIG